MSSPDAPEPDTAARTTSMRYEEAPARRRQILDTLSADGFLSVRDIAAELGVSDMTVRRDLRRLEVAGEVRVVHGGASLPHGTLRTPDFLARASQGSDAKRRIARAALRLVADGDAVAVDAGTTAYALAAALPERQAGCVITHSVPVVQLMLGRSPGRVVVLGGDLLASSQAMIGPMSVHAAQALRPRTFFLGVGAVDQWGAYVDTDLERPTKLALMSAADRVVLLADSHKFARSAPVRLCELDALHTLVTDTEPPGELAHRLEDAGVELIIAD